MKIRIQLLNNLYLFESLTDVPWIQFLLFSLYA